MDFSYAQASWQYRRLLKNDIVIFFLDGDLMARYVSPNNDILGAAPGVFAPDFPIRRFMPELAAAELRAFYERRDSTTVIDYSLMVSEDESVPVRHFFFLATDGGFGDGVVIRSYAVLMRDYSPKTDVCIAAYETALGFVRGIGNMPSAVFIHDGDKIEYANQAFAGLLGYRPEELTGAPVARLFRDETTAVARVCDESGFTAQMLYKDGRVLTARAYVHTEEPQKSYIVTVEDVADYNTRERADAVFRRIYALSSHAAALLDADLAFTWLNASFSRLTDYTADSLEGKHVSALYSGEHKSAFYDAIWESAVAQGLYRGTVWVRAAGGNLPVVLAATAVKNQSDAVVTYILTLSHAPNTLQMSESAKNPNTDKLTGLHTKEYFDSLLTQKLATCRTSGGACAVLMFDIDRFNTVNEMYGVKISDMLLLQIAQRFVKTLPEGSVAARSSDEFWAIIEDGDTLADLDAFADRLIEAMSRTFRLSSCEIDLYISLALVPYSDESPTKEVMYKQLAQSMSVPKFDWQSSYQIYQSRSALAKRASIEEELREAIIKHEFVLYYFPKISTPTQKLIGLEALLRWNKPGKGLVAPGEFIPAAEDAGLMPALGEMVFQMACAQMQQWDRKGLKGFNLAVNISSLQLRDEHLANKLIKIMAMADVDPNRFEFDLTESFAFQEQSITSRILGQMVEAGVRFSIDNFGTGYSSISLLKKYPISALKIDRQFIKALPENKDYCALFSAMVAMAHSLDMKAVAEGVETFAQFEYIKASNCDEMQGYFIGKPASAEDIEELIRSYGC